MLFPHHLTGWLKTKKTCLGLLAILLFSFLLKLLYHHLEPTVSRDGCILLQLVQTWHDTGSFQGVLDKSYSFWLPPYLMQGLMNLGISSETAGVGLNLMLGTFTPLITYGIAFEVTQRKDISMCSALLIAVNPSMNSLSIEVQRDMIYLFFIGLSLWLFFAGIRRQKKIFWCGAGLAVGCAMLTRIETLEILGILPIILFLLCAGKHLHWKRGLCYAGIFYLSFFGCIIAWTFLMQTQDSFFLNYDLLYHKKLQKMANPF